MQKQAPIHIGIIMDGNGRWACYRNMARTQGHLEGLKTAKRIVKASSDRGIPFLTLYAFSTENWKRTAEEVNFIMGLIRQHLLAQMDFYRENQIRLRFAGSLSSLSKDIADVIHEALSITASFSKMQVILAINYGGRDEIIRAANRLISVGLPITEETINKNLDNPDVPDPDLIIRTAGEYRTSNFLLWEAAYAEYYISDKLWPDFLEEDFDAALSAFQKRIRRFGGLKDEQNH
ncbi:MAG: di-trans,poly-cis-decaprenylcistransferase [Spirochaetaceae bacterium]|jgi:undecaprenyl diphosphate synthase|nr:di-trans,poly-cis-decaprenylcistransferase [Spirochaetaceae bacterium]